MRIFPGQQTNEQFIQIVAAQQCLTLQKGLPPKPFCTRQRTNFSLAKPPQGQRMERQQYPSHGGTRTSRTTSDHRDASSILGKHLDQQAGLLVRLRMQNVGGLSHGAISIIH